MVEDIRKPSDRGHSNVPFDNMSPGERNGNGQSKNLNWVRVCKYLKEAKQIGGGRGMIHRKDLATFFNKSSSTMKRGLGRLGCAIPKGNGLWIHDDIACEIGQINEGVYIQNVPDLKGLIPFFDPKLPLGFHGGHLITPKEDKSVPVTFRHEQTHLWIYCAAYIKVAFGHVEVIMQSKKRGQKYNLTLEQLLDFDIWLKKTLFEICNFIPRLQLRRIDVAQDLQVIPFAYPQTEEVLKGIMYLREYKINKNELFWINADFRRRELSVINEKGIELLPLATKLLKVESSKILMMDEIRDFSRTAKESVQMYNNGLVDVIGNLNKVVRENDDGIQWMMNSQAALHEKIDLSTQEINEKIEDRFYSLGNKLDTTTKEIDVLDDTLDRGLKTLEKIGRSQLKLDDERNFYLRDQSIQLRHQNELLSESNQLQITQIQKNNQVIFELKNLVNKFDTWKRIDTITKLGILSTLFETEKRLNKVTKVINGHFKVSRQAIRKLYQKYNSDSSGGTNIDKNGNFVGTELSMDDDKLLSNSSKVAPRTKREGTNLDKSGNFTGTTNRGFVDNNHSVPDEVAYYTSEDKLGNFVGTGLVGSEDEIKSINDLYYNMLGDKYEVAPSQYHWLQIILVLKKRGSSTVDEMTIILQHLPRASIKSRLSELKAKGILSITREGKGKKTRNRYHLGGNGV